MSNFTTVALEDIQFITKALRTHALDSDIIVERAEDMKRNGMNNTPTAFRLASGMIVIGDGATRLTAANRLMENGETIKDVPAGQFPVNLIDKSDDPSFTEVDVLMAQVRGNATIEKTDNVSYVNAMFEIQKAKDLSVAELAVEFGISEKHVRSLMKTLRLPMEVREEIGEDLSFSNAVQLQRIANKLSAPCYGEDGFSAAVETAKDMGTKEFEQYVKDIEEGHAEKVKAFREENPAEKTDPVFVAKEKFIGAGELAVLRDSIRATGTPDQINLMDRIYGVDEVSVNAQREAWNAKQAERELKAKTRKEGSKKITDLSDDEIEAILAQRKAEQE